MSRRYILQGAFMELNFYSHGHTMLCSYFWVLCMYVFAALPVCLCALLERKNHFVYRLILKFLKFTLLRLIQKMYSVEKHFLIRIQYSTRTCNECRKVSQQQTELIFVEWWRCSFSLCQWIMDSIKGNMPENFTVFKILSM